MNIFIKARELRFPESWTGNLRAVPGSKATGAQAEGYWSTQKCSKQPEALEGNTGPLNAPAPEDSVTGHPPQGLSNPGLTSQSLVGL